MKQVKRVFALLLSLALIVTMASAIPASADTTALTAADFVNIPVTNTESIGSTTGTAVTQSAEGHFVSGETGSHSYYYQFTLENPSLVTISTFANVFDWNFQGDSVCYIGADMQCGYNFLTAWTNKETKNLEGALEAGTYYIRQDIVKTDKECGPVPNPTVSISITAQTVSRTENIIGSTKENAIPLVNGVTSKGFISSRSEGNKSLAANCIGKQFFKLDVNGPTTLNYTAAFSRHTNLDFEFDKSVAVIDKNGAELNKRDLIDIFNEGSVSSSVELPAKGTYYITVTTDSFTAIDLTATWEDVVVEPTIKLTVNKIKKNAKKVKGTSVAGASIKVKVGKKTYKGTANAKGKFTVKTKKIKKGTKVKVTASLDGYKTKSKTVKAK